MGLSPGTRLGHYDVTALIGEGGMGQVPSRPARRENYHPWFRSQAQKLRGHEPDRLDGPRFPGSRYVA